jgi:hypothetical protein
MSASCQVVQSNFIADWKVSSTSQSARGFLLDLENMFRYALLALAYVASSGAQIYYITSPQPNSNLEAGKTFNIEYILAEKASSDQVSSVTITLMKGSSLNGEVVSVIGQGIGASARSFAWAIPGDLPAKTDDYFLQMAAKMRDGSTQYNYSARFSVKNSDPTRSSGKVDDKNRNNGTAVVDKILGDVGKTKGNGTKGVNNASLPIDNDASLVRPIGFLTFVAMMMA